MGLDASGNLFIADTGNKRIVEYSVTGVPSVVSATGTALVSPTSVKVLPSGALVVADSTLGLVLIDDGVASVLSTGSIKLSSTQGLSLDFAGNIYVADPVGGQVVELNLNSPAAASFPDTLKPDSSGSHTSTETSYIYNDGNATLNFTADPTVVDNTSSATNEFSVDPNNACLASTSLTPDRGLRLGHGLHAVVNGGGVYDGHRNRYCRGQLPGRHSRLRTPHPPLRLSAASALPVARSRWI